MAQNIQDATSLPIKHVHAAVIASTYHYPTIFTEFHLFGVPLRWHACWKVPNERSSVQMVQVKTITGIVYHKLTVPMANHRMSAESTSIFVIPEKQMGSHRCAYILGRENFPILTSK
jgi:hypothetical protein